MRRRIASVLIAAIVAMMGVFQQLQGFAMALETLPKPTDQDIRIYNTETYPTVSRRFSGRGAFKTLQNMKINCEVGWTQTIYRFRASRNIRFITLLFCRRCLDGMKYIFGLLTSLT